MLTGLGKGPLGGGNIGDLNPSKKNVGSKTNEGIKSKEVEVTLSTLKDGFVEMSDTFNVIPEVVKDLYK